jgi:hypothetical protein
VTKTALQNKILMILNLEITRDKVETRRKISGGLRNNRKNSDFLKIGWFLGHNWPIKCNKTALAA